MLKRILSIFIVLFGIFTASSCESFLDREATYQFFYAMKYYLTDEEAEFPAIKAYFETVVDFDKEIKITGKKSVTMHKANEMFLDEIADINGEDVLKMISGEEFIEISLLMQAEEGYSLINYVGWSHSLNTTD